MIFECLVIQSQQTPLGFYGMKTRDENSGLLYRESRDILKAWKSLHIKPDERQLTGIGNLGYSSYN